MPIALTDVIVQNCHYMISILTPLSQIDSTLCSIIRKYRPNRCSPPGMSNYMVFVRDSVDSIG